MIESIHISALDIISIVFNERKKHFICFQFSLFERKKTTFISSSFLSVFLFLLLFWWILAFAEVNCARIFVLYCSYDWINGPFHASVNKTIKMLNVWTHTQRKSDRRTHRKVHNWNSWNLLNFFYSVNHPNCMLLSFHQRKVV